MNTEYIGMIETNEGVLYINKDNHDNDEYTLTAGTATNSCCLTSDTVQGDNCFSFDENLQAFIEDLLEKYGEYND